MKMISKAESINPSILCVSEDGEGFKLWRILIKDECSVSSNTYPSSTQASSHLLFSPLNGASHQTYPLCCCVIKIFKEFPSVSPQLTIIQNSFISIIVSQLHKSGSTSSPTRYSSQPLLLSSS